MGNKSTGQHTQSKSTSVSMWQFFVFIGLGYAISWLVWWQILPALKRFDGDPESLPSIYYALLAFGGIGPTLSAIFTVSVFGGWGELKTLFSRIRIWRVHPIWYAVALFLFPLADLTARIIFHVTHQGDVSIDPQRASLLPISIAFALVSGALMEELGWRGFFQPALRQKFGMLMTALIIGLVWAFWHTPLFFVGFGSFVSGTGGIPSAVLAYACLSVALSLCMVWLGHHTGESVFLAYIFHFSFNAALGPILLAPTSPTVQIQLMIWTCVSLMLFFSVAVGVRRLIVLRASKVAGHNSISG